MEKIYYKEIKRHLKNGGVIAIPTDTVFGIACSIYSEEGHKRIFEIKHRDGTKLLPIFVNKVNKLKKFAEVLPEDDDLVRRWPCDLTLVFNAKKSFPHPEYKTIGVRIPNDIDVLNLLKKVGPLFVTSCNISGKQPLVTLKEAENFAETNTDVLIPIKKDSLCQEPSTIYDCRKKIILRQGKLRL